MHTVKVNHVEKVIDYRIVHAPPGLYKSRHYNELVIVHNYSTKLENANGETVYGICDSGKVITNSSYEVVPVLHIEVDIEKVS